MKHPEAIIVSPYDSPCGRLLLGSLGDALCLCDWRPSAHANHAERVDTRLCRAFGAVYAAGSSPVIERAKACLDEYFAGCRRGFSLPLVLAGTEFQRRVWEALSTIPYGATVTYGDLARSLGCEGAVRAVAGAVGANALSVFLPCHRVTAAAGSMGGYAGGVGTKSFLLELEKRVVVGFSADSALDLSPVCHRADLA